MPGLVYSEPPELDHIVHLVSPGRLEEAMDQFRRLGFSVERGGVHADGLTQNALIVLTDGVYVELIEFLDRPMQTGSNSETLAAFRQRREGHWWWGKQPGWVDWCLGGGVKDRRTAAINRASEIVSQQRKSEAGPTNTEKDATQAAAATSDPEKRGGTDATPSPPLVRYSDAASGGRKALSGKEIRWHVTFPSPQESRGTYPFWCEDETPRWWRVPTPSPPHPNLTRGLSALTLLYYPDNFPSRLASLQLILSAKDTPDPSASDILKTIVDTRPPPVTEGKTALPDSFVELYLATPEGPLLPLRIKAADDPAELAWLAKYGEGLFEVEISVAPEKLPITAPPDGIERETSKLGYGRLRLHPMRVPLQ